MEHLGVTKNGCITNLSYLLKNMHSAPFKINQGGTESYFTIGYFESYRIARLCLSHAICNTF